MPYLKNLYIDRNIMGNIESWQFQGLEKLKILNLQANNISQLFEKNFIHLKSLRKLYLGHNKIRKIHPEAFTSNVLMSIQVEASKIHLPALLVKVFRGTPKEKLQHSSVTAQDQADP